MNWQRVLLCLCAVCVVAARFAHLDLVWIEEAYGMAAGAEVLRGKLLYRDIWFDKPPLYALFYALAGASAGVALRAAGSLLVLLSCGLTYVAGKRFWNADAGVVAACFLGFYLTFWIPAAVIAVAPDLLMIAPHVAAVYLAASGRPFWSGVVAGVALLSNSKGLLVLPVCLAFSPGGWLRLVGGWVLVQAASFAVFPVGDVWREVWWWGWRYSRDSFLAHPIEEGVKRTVNWAGFHAAIVVAAGFGLWKERNWRWWLWLCVSAVAVAGGLRFFPRYYFHLLPVVALLAGRGVTLMRPGCRITVIALLSVPLVRFAPAHIRAASGTAWADTALMEDSRAVGKWLRANSTERSTLFVWGYRPDIYVFSGLAAGTRFLDSQALNGVLADRHLTQSEATFSALAETNRRELVRTSPIFIVDGLGPLNPQLSIDRYDDLRKWLSGYELAYRTPSSVVYRRR